MRRYKVIDRQILEGVVKAVHDGDSYKIDFGSETNWVRIYGCDSPELISNYVTKDQPFGRQSGNLIRELIKGKTVKVETLFKDQYGRLVCNVYLNDINLTEYIISNGLGWYMEDAKMEDSLKVKLKADQLTAKAAKKGLWGESGRKVRPETWRKNNRRFTMEKEYGDLW